MNRAERRRNAKKINTPQKLEQFSAEMDRRLRMEYQEKFERKTDWFIETYTMMVAYVLNYKLGLGRKRLPKIMNEIMRHVEMIDEGYLSFEDCEQELKRVGVSLNFTKGGQKNAEIQKDR